MMRALYFIFMPAAKGYSPTEARWCAEQHPEFPPQNGGVCL
jgi:hypothetical protein